jgi:hypothetical protein
MENDFTSLEDYNNGFLGGEAEGAASLLKAMQAGAITGRDTTDLALTAEPLKAESLERTIKLLEFRTKDIRLLNAMPKMVAYNTVEEFLQLQSYGADRGGFYNEGELSDVEDSTYVRRAELIKYIQVTGEITMQAQMVRSFIDVYRKEVENKTMWIMRRANSSMTSGNADVIPQEFNGLYRQHANVGTGGNDFLYASLEAYFTGGAVVDLRGASIKQKDVENGAIIVDNGFGNPTDLFAPNTVISALGVDYFQDQRILLDGKGVNGTFGTVPKAIDTSIGSINLSSDKFMKQKAARLLTDNATSPKAPGAPVTGGAPSVSASTLSKFVAGDAGSAYYAVSAINRYGESQLTLIDASAAAIIAGVRVDLTFTVGAGANPTSGYVIYRSKITTAATSAGVQFYPIFSVSTADLAAGYDGGGAGTVRDQGRFLPAMEQCFLTQMDEEVLSFKQLAPISKLDLAIISMSRRFIAFNFCTPNLYAPKKFVRYINVSPTVTPR